MRNYTFGTLLAVFSLQCNNVGFVDKAKAVVNNEFGVVVFHTNTTGTGDFLNSAIQFSGLCNGPTGIAKANCICASEAASQGFTGTYRAWLSIAGVDAICNIQGLENTNCSINSELGPFLGKNGSSYSILAENYSELSATGFKVPLSNSLRKAYTGTGLNGRNSGGNNCAHFTAAASVGTGGELSQSGNGFTNVLELSCGVDTGSLVCMKQTK
ncbi:MAG: hypothetical protein U1F16_17765 [Turneriella sp.]